MGRRPKTMDLEKPYKSGDQLHITVTKDFAPMATDFFRFCKKYHYSPSDVIRGCMIEWLEKTRKMRDFYESSEFKKEEIIQEIIEMYPWMKGSLKIKGKKSKR